MMMKIFRSREIKFLFIFLCSAGVAGTLLCALISPAAALSAAMMSVAMIIATLVFTAWRYRQLERLCDEVRRVNRGDYALRPEQSDEGELSILRSEICKTTLVLREQNELLSRDKKHLADSLSDISHQLRTPLTSMFMMTDLLCDGNPDEEKRREFTDRIRAQLERLQWLVESLLKLSRLDAGAVVLTPASVSPEELFQRAAAPVAIAAEVKNILLICETDGRPLHCDHAWTAEALVNILKNCIEHTPEHGKIGLYIKTLPLCSEITVCDSGTGIDKSDLPYVFDRFYRGRNAHSDSVGIGLAMSKSIIERQGGSVYVENAPHGGAVFTLRLPAPKGAANNPS